MMVFICSSACEFSRQVDREAAAGQTESPDPSIVRKSDDSSGEGYSSDGNTRGQKKDTTEEIKKLQEFVTRIEGYLALNPDWKNEAWMARAVARSQLGDAAPLNAIKAYTRGVTASAAARFTEALKHYEEADLLDPLFPWAANNLAWVLATCPDEKLRDGRRAIELARKAIKVPGVEVPDFVNTLAAAHAAAGEFDVAVRLCRKSIEMWPRDEFKQMLRCFLANSVYLRNGPPPQKSDFLSAEGFDGAKWGMSKLDVMEVFPESAMQSNDVVLARRERAGEQRIFMALHFRYDMLYRVRVVASGVREADIETEFIKEAASGKNPIRKVEGADDSDRKAAAWESDETRIEMVYTRSKSEAVMDFMSKRYEKLAPPQPAKRQNS
jgi:tetratricopeptide (TPR) repeat protein